MPDGLSARVRLLSIHGNATFVQIGTSQHEENAYRACTRAGVECQQHQLRPRQSRVRSYTVVAHKQTSDIWFQRDLQADGDQWFSMSFLKIWVGKFALFEAGIVQVRLSGEIADSVCTLAHMM